MEVTVADAGPCRKTLTIKISPDAIRAHVAETFRNAAQQVDLKGFRRGKVPRKVLESRFGPAILSEAKESLVSRSFEDALREKDLSVLGQPELEGIDAEPLDESKPLEFQVHVDVHPQLELHEVKSIEIPRGRTDVTDEDVQSALEQLAAEKRSLGNVEGPVEDGDFIKVDLTYKDEGGAVVVEKKGSQLNTRIPIAGTAPETFSQVLQGAAVGEQRELELTFPDTFEKEEVRGKPGKVELSIHEILRVTPAPVDDELAKGYDFENLDALKEHLRKQIGEQKVAHDKARQEEDLFNILINENPFELPQSMVEQQKKHSLAEFEDRLKKAGLGEDEVAQKVAEAEGEAADDAERRVRVFFLLQAIAKKEKIFVTESDVDVELRAIASHHNVSVGEVREHYEKQRLLGDLRLGLMERKVRDFLRENAKLTD